MNIICKEIRESARQSLSGKWMITTLSVLLFSIFNLIQYIFPEFSADHSSLVVLVSYIYILLLTFGYTKFTLNISRDKEVAINDIFIDWKRFFKALLMVLLVGLYTMVWSLLFIIPGIIATLKYSMTFYIWADNPDIGISEAISASVKMTKGHKWDIFRLGLSFIGWKILVSIPAIVFMIWHISQGDFYVHFVNPIYKMSMYKPAMIISFIGTLFLTSYIKVSMAKLYDKLTEKNVTKIDVA